MVLRSGKVRKAEVMCHSRAARWWGSPGRAVGTRTTVSGVVGIQITATRDVGGPGPQLATCGDPDPSLQGCGDPDHN